MSVVTTLKWIDYSIQPAWHINSRMNGHAKIEHNPIGIMLPIELLNKINTDFSKDLLKAYKDSGVIIDLENRKFKAPLSMPVTKDFYSFFRDDYVFKLANVIKFIGTPLSDDDIIIASSVLKIMPLFCKAKDGLQGMNKVMDDIINDLDSDGERVSNEIAAIQAFDKAIIVHDLVKNVKLTDSEKVSIVNNAYLEVSEEGKRFTAAYVAKVRDLNQEKTNEDYTVYISGNTKDNKDTIKEYAKRYGKIVQRGKKYFWDTKKSVWIISYNAYRAMIKDYPSLENELIMEKAD